MSLLSTKFHEILFSSFRGVVLTSCFSRIFSKGIKISWQYTQQCMVSLLPITFHWNSVQYFLTSCFRNFGKFLSLKGITPTKFRRSKCPGNMHNYIWCPYYLPSFMKCCSVVSQELIWQAASVVNVGKFLSSKEHNSYKIQAIKISW